MEVVGSRPGSHERHPVKLLVVLASTRPGRLGAPVAHWAEQLARESGRFDEVGLVDLAEVGLPLLDEPHHPRADRYTHDHTRTWSALVAPHDAYLFVTPEYNLAPPPSLTNAIDFLHNEWRWKAAAMVSYGGVAGGVRSAQVVKQMLASMNCFTVHEAVMIPLIHERVDADGAFEVPAGADVAAAAMFDNLATLARALATARAASA